MVRGFWYGLLETLLFALPPVIGVGIVGLLQNHPDPLVGQLLFSVATVGGLAIRVGVPVCVLFDARGLRAKRLWRPNGPAYALGAFFVSAPVFGLLYLYRRHERISLAPSWDGWWVLVAASLGGAISGIVVVSLTYLLSLPPAILAAPALVSGITLAAFPVGIYRDAIYVRNSSRKGWRPNPALYLALAFVSLLVTVLQPPVAAYYLLRRGL
ncbi:MAG: hypothetical protein IH933_08315 [Euryarchaeota archaeon]|jgi:hypothetical protein|nr:hypothetical protein [Euryarchaeota archaeon]